MPYDTKNHRIFFILAQNFAFRGKITLINEVNVAQNIDFNRSFINKAEGGKL